MSAALELGLESRLELVSLAGAAVRAMCVARGADATSAVAVELSVVEIAANVVEHAYAGRQDGPIWIRLDFWPGRVVVEIADLGEGIPASQISEAKLPAIDVENVLDLPEGGFGLALVRMLVDSFEVNREKGWNVLRFTRSLARALG